MLRMLLVIGLEIYVTENWVLQAVLGPLDFYVMNHVSRKKKVLKFSVEILFLSSAFVLYDGWRAVGLPLNMTTFTPDLTAAWYNIKLMDTENCMHIVAKTTALLLQHFTALHS